jgi:hypothetical protein
LFGGYLFQVYVHTEKNVLIEINPQTRIPRTFKRFAGLMGKLYLQVCLGTLECLNIYSEKILLEATIPLLA